MRWATMVLAQTISAFLWDERLLYLLILEFEDFEGVTLD